VSKKITEQKKKARIRRKKHIRKIVHGTAERPRLVIYRSLKHMYAQLVDDEGGKTVLGVSSLSPELKSKLDGKKASDAAAAVGEACAQLALEKKIQTVVFDRNGFPYHGRVKAIAEGARKGGLKF
jgi:large subunit ribosomal protein L18